MIVVPLVLVVALPALVIYSASIFNLASFIGGGATQFITNFPPDLLPMSFDERQTVVYAMLVYFFAPFFLIIPLMVSSIIASNSFAGEKERKTLEGLLYTPLTDQELILGKILVAWIPTVGVSWLCFALYTFIINALGFDLFHYLFFPTATWLILIFWLVPMVSFFSLSLIVLVSEKVTEVWEAQQISALLLVPLLGLVASQASGAIYINTDMVFVAGFTFFILDVFVYWLIVKIFDRERMVTKLV